MAQLIQGFFILFSCWLLTEQVHGFPKQLLDFESTFSGVYNNWNQVRSRGSKKDNITIKIIPLEVPAFPESLTHVFEEDVNGLVYRLQLAVITGYEDDVIYTTVYNFTDPRRYKAGEFDISELSTRKREDFHTDNTTSMVAQIISDDVYVVTYPDYNHVVNGKHLAYTVTFTCNNLVSAVPSGSKEKADKTLYNFRRQGDKFPVPGAPHDYVGPCDKQEDLSDQNS